jgi:CheY-like chemotaxis protein
MLARRLRSDADLLVDQLRGIDAWTQAHSLSAAEVDEACSRESRLDLARRRDVVMRQRQAMIGWTERQLRGSDRVLRSVAPTRVVIAHRHDWFKARVTSGLLAGGIAVVADLENGADALGIVIAEQPDFLLIQDRLPMVNGLDLTRDVCRYAPSTVVVVQVTNDWEIGPFLDAGATAVYTKRTSPADVASDLLAAVPC